MSGVTVRLAFWNTWLLSPRLWRTGPRIPGSKGWFAPEVEARAPLAAKAVANRFDVAALGEVFETSELDTLETSWPEATLVRGPGPKLPRLQGSGLATFVGPETFVLRSASHVYRSGGDLRDSDTYATKGALLTTVRYHPDLPPLDLFSTHLLAGGELLPIPGADDTRRHHIARMAQVDELIGFIERAHDPSHILVVVGDFNVIGGTADYEDLAAHMDRAQLKDIWPNNGIGPGPTCTFTDPSQIPPDPDEPDMVMDTEHDEAGERLDYIWLRSPDNLIVTPERPRRWAFSDRGVQGGPAGSLSDHLAISTTLQIQARDAQP